MSTEATTGHYVDTEIKGVEWELLTGGNGELVAFCIADRQRTEADPAYVIELINTGCAVRVGK